jgi:hypothetical protein
MDTAITAAKSSKPLKTLLEKVSQYPVQIQVVPEADVKFKVASEPRRTLDLGSLTISSQDDIYEETFIKGNGCGTGE